MEKHESRLLNIGETYNWVNYNGDIIIKNVVFGEIVYIDSNNFLHNLNGYAWKIFTIAYYIHGVRYNNKRDWGLGVNRIKMISEL